MFDIEKQVWPPSEDPTYLASVGLTQRQLENLCVGTANVVGVTDLDNNLVSVEFDSVIYEDVPVWMHTDRGTFAAQEQEEEQTDPADYFEGAASQFVYYEDSYFDRWNDTTNVWYSTNAVKPYVFVLHYRDEVPDGQQRVVGVVGIKSHRLESTGPWPTHQFFFAIEFSYVVLDINAAGTTHSAYVMWDLATGEVAKIPNPTFTNMVDADFGETHTDYEYFFKADGDYQGVTRITNGLDDTDLNYYDHYYDVSSWIPTWPAGSLETEECWEYDTTAGFTNTASSGWWTGTYTDVNNLSMTNSCLGSSWTRAVSGSTMTEEFEFYKTQYGFYASTGQGAAGYPGGKWGDFVQEFKLPGDTVTIYEKNVTSLAVGDTEMVTSSLPWPQSQQAISGVVSVEVSIDDEVSSYEWAYDFTEWHHGTSLEWWRTGERSDFFVIDMGQQWNDGTNGWVGSPNFILNAYSAFTLLFFLEQHYECNGHTYQEDPSDPTNYKNSTTPEYNEWTSIPTSFQFTPHSPGDAGTGAFADQLSFISGVAADAITADLNDVCYEWYSLKAYEMVVNMNLLAVPFDARTIGLTYDPSYTP